MFRSIFAIFAVFAVAFLWNAADVRFSGFPAAANADEPSWPDRYFELGPVISDIETDKVVVTTSRIVRSTEEEILAEARRGCALHGRVPIPISWHSERGTHLFACVHE